MVLLIVCSILLTVEAANATDRERIPLAGEWRQQFSRSAESVPEGKAVMVQLPYKRPHGRFAKDMDAVWFDRSVFVPEGWEGRRVIINISQVFPAVDVFVNGTNMGTIHGHGGELDITGGVRFGEENQLRLFIGRLGKGHKNTHPLLPHLVQGMQDQVNRGGWDRGLDRGVVLGLPEDFYLESQPEGFRLGHVWYRTFTRGGSRIEPQIEFFAPTPLVGGSLRVEIRDAIDGKIVREATTPLPSSSVGWNEVAVNVEAADLKLWGLGEPSLYYGQVVLLDADGAELDRTPKERFGIREIWTQGRDFFLNNQQVHFNVEWNIDKVSPENLAKGVNLVELNFPHEFANFLGPQIETVVLADEIGVACAHYGVIHVGLDLSTPGVLEAYEDWAKHYLRQQRNHPSVFFYALGWLGPGNYLDFVPDKIGRSSNLDLKTPNYARSYLVHKRLDPTRPLYFHGGPRGGDISTGNLYMNHIPIQEVEDWFGLWSREGDMPIMAIEGMPGPLSVDFLRGGMAYSTEYAAMHLGDRAYAEETDEYVAATIYQIPRSKHWDKDTVGTSASATEVVKESLTRGLRAWRFVGVPHKTWAWNFGKSENARAIHQHSDDLLRPVMAWLGGPAEAPTSKDHQFFEGERVRKGIQVIRDLPRGEKWSISWRFALDGTDKAVEMGEAEHFAGPYHRATLPIEFTAPSVKTPTRGTLSFEIRAEENGNVVAGESIPLTIFPTNLPANERPEVSVLDPEGQTSEWLKARGVKVIPYDPKNPPRLLVIGRRALQGVDRLPFQVEDVAKGMRVVIFEQRSDVLAAMGLRLEDRSPRKVFPRVSAHPILHGLNEEMLRDWRGSATLISEGPEGDSKPVGTRLGRAGNRGSVASVVLETPHTGTFTPLIDCEFDLSFSPLMLWRHGQGEILFCQLDLTDRVDKDPAATQIAENLLRWMESDKAIPQIKSAVAFDKETMLHLLKLGFHTRAYAGKLKVDEDVLVVRGGALPPGESEAVREFVEGGGEVLWLAGVAEDYFKGRVRSAPVQAFRAASKIDRHPWLEGVGPQNLRVRVPVPLIKVESSDPRFESLADGFLGVLSEGSGRHFFCAFDESALQAIDEAYAADPHRDAVDPKGKKAPVLNKESLINNQARSFLQTARLQSQLLANLGVRSSDEMVNRLFTMHRETPMTPINSWVLLGPFPPPKGALDAFDRDDLNDLGADRSRNFRSINSRGEAVTWLAPNDYLNGLGINGEVDIGKMFAVRLHDVAVAVTQVWSDEEREAVIEAGADWWLRVDVNGKEVFRTAENKGHGILFANKIPVSLKAGWNDFRCLVGAGSNSFKLWFRITDPNGLVVSQTTSAPEAPSRKITRPLLATGQSEEPAFSLYVDEPNPRKDPYGYSPW